MIISNQNGALSSGLTRCFFSIKKSSSILCTLIFVLSLLTIEIQETYAQTSTDANPIHQLPEVRSVNGVLNVTIEAAEKQVQFGQASFVAQVYNGEYAGPVLRVNPGDTLNIKYVNHLPHPSNLHFHGILTSPRDNSDNIHILVNPGDSFDYEVKIPLTQSPGVYWYHDHTHGISDNDVMSGLSGTIIVDGLQQQLPELANAKEQLFVLKDYQFAETDDAYITKILHRLIQTINGQEASKIVMHAGETQLWRFTNQSADYYFHLSLNGHKFRVIGSDGSAALKETAVDKLDIGPASRFDVLVDAGDAGSYDLVSEGAVTGDGPNKSMNRILGQLVVEGEPLASVGSLASFPPKEDLESRKIDAERTFTFSQLNDDKNYFLNGKKFDHNRVDARIPLGNIEEWTISNDTDEFHVFHIHQVNFQVVDINGVAQEFNGYVDNVKVPARGQVKIRLAFTDPNIVGTFVIHCHILQHEDGGMMAQIEVYDPKISSIVRFWHSMFSCCSSMKFSGGCFWSNIRIFLSSLTS